MRAKEKRDASDREGALVFKLVLAPILLFILCATLGGMIVPESWNITLPAVLENILYPLLIATGIGVFLMGPTALVSFHIGFVTERFSFPMRMTLLNGAAALGLLLVYFYDALHGEGLCWRVRNIFAIFFPPHLGLTLIWLVSGIRQKKRAAEEEKHAANGKGESVCADC